MSQVDVLARTVAEEINKGELTQASRSLGAVPAWKLDHVLERLDPQARAVAFRLLPKSVALDVFEALDPALRGELILALQDETVIEVFDSLDPDDRVWLLEELPAGLANRLLQGLSAHERELTAKILGYPSGAVGRRMTPEFVHAGAETTAAQTLQQIRERTAEAEAVYVIPVVNTERQLTGVVPLHDLVVAEPDAQMSQLALPSASALATSDAEAAALLCTDLKLLSLPIVDSEQRLVGLLTFDDALDIVNEAAEEDSARAGGAEPLRRPYLSTSVWQITRSRVVWLLVLAISALLTVQVLEIFEATLAQKVTLALFIPLLTGTAGNTGAQAATTVTRALALGDLGRRDVLRVMSKEVRVGLTLGLCLGGLGFGLAALVYGLPMAGVIGLTLLSVCTLAATVGGLMPLVARSFKADPAVFSTPFITTFCDASGLVLYFLIARALLGL